MTHGDAQRIADAVCKTLDANSLGDMSRDIVGLKRGTWPA